MRTSLRVQLPSLTNANSAGIDNVNVNVGKCEPLCNSSTYAFSNFGANGHYVLCHENDRKGNKRSNMKKPREVIEQWITNIETFKSMVYNDTTNVGDFLVLPEDINICGQKNKDTYVVSYKQQHVHGVSLQDFIKKPPLDLRPNDILYIFIQLTFVLSWIHHKKKKHNDLHLGNILIERLANDDVVVLRDSKKPTSFLESTMKMLSAFARDNQERFKSGASMKMIMNFRHQLQNKLFLFSSLKHEWVLATPYKISIIDWEEFEQPFVTSNKKCIEHLDETNVSCAENLVMTALNQNEGFKQNFLNT